MNLIVSRRTARTLGLSSILLFFACIPELDPGSSGLGDTSPPALVSWRLDASTALTIIFDEAVSALAQDFFLRDGAEPEPVGDCRPGDTPDSVVVTLSRAPEPGRPVMLDGSVADGKGNSVTFSLPFWGFNPTPARLMLNEIISQGSSSRPDLVEFRVLDGGNLAGLCFLVGSVLDYEHRYVFPNRVVEPGDYVVLHMKPLGNPLELDELQAKDQSAGVDANPEAWDFWYRGDGGGLPGTNGVLSLASSPYGSYQDALLYSDRTSQSDQKYRGFGSAATRDRADALFAAGMWLAAGEMVAPEDCFPSGGTTSTRSMCRGSASLDCDAASDWHIVPTKGATPGSVNSDEVYAP